MVAVQPQSVVMQENAVATHLPPAAKQGRRRQGRGGDRHHGGWSSGRDGTDGCCRQQARGQHHPYGPIVWLGVPRTDRGLPQLGLERADAARADPPAQARCAATAPEAAAWTHRFKQPGQPARYELFDQSWLSPALADGRPARWSTAAPAIAGDGSDRDRSGGSGTRRTDGVLAWAGAAATYPGVHGCWRAFSPASLPASPAPCRPSSPPPGRPP